MELRRGLVVRSLAGHDKGDYFVVLQSDDTFALLSDGKHRPLERPKKKKHKHLAQTLTVVPERSMETNREIRNALRPFATPAAHCSL